MTIGGNATVLTRGAIRRSALVACALVLAGCAAAPRIPYTQQEQAEAVIPGIPGARLWADDPTIGRGRPPLASRVALSQPTVLALSGASGERANLLQSDGIAGLFGTSIFKTAPLRDFVARHVDAGLLQAIAQEYRAGRRLYVVTTNLDAQRTAIWDMGKIAASGEPGALELFRNVLTASASIPGVFSPVLIDVEAEGRRFAEMHVDGGVTTNVLVVPEAVLVSGTPLFPADARPKVY